MERKKIRIERERAEWIRYPVSTTLWRFGPAKGANENGSNKERIFVPIDKRIIRRGVP